MVLKAPWSLAPGNEIEFRFSRVQFFALADALVHQGAWVWPVGVTDMLGL